MRVLDIFEDLAKKVPRCSGNTGAMRDFIAGFAKNCGYESQVDGAGNVLCKKGEAKICLQAHYDMVCLGDGSPVETYEEDGWLRARNSTLGADNGIGVAMALALMEEGAEVECLFTNDEEIGLLGARGLELEIGAQYILNLDAEEEGFVYIGCAGGFELKAVKKLQYICDYDDYSVEDVVVRDLCGGHSGIDIDKNIPNALQECLKKASQKSGALVWLKGGEKLNSIPKNARAKLAKSASDLQKTESAGLVNFLLSVPSGVIEQNSDLNIPELSVNLSLLSIENSTVEVSMYARGMSLKTQNSFEIELVGIFEKAGFTVGVGGHYAPWKPEINAFAQMIHEQMKKSFQTSGFKAIHAGLECGVLGEKLPNKLFAAIGPNIVSPHTLEERVEIASVERVYAALGDIVRASF
jgi:dipeptidase D